MFFGPVLTNAVDIKALIAYRNKSNMNSIKVITDWGLDKPWNDVRRGQLLTLTPYPIVRTTAGDPSNKAALNYLIPQRVTNELSPWIQFKPDLMVELGNEPNHVSGFGLGVGENVIWTYRWHLMESIKRIRTYYPMVHIIAPAFIVNDSMRRWFDICKDVFRMCDSLGVHVYEHESFDPTFAGPKTEQLKQIHDLYLPLCSEINKPLAMTEFGINSPTRSKREKYEEYITFAKSLPSVYAGVNYYHINVKQDIDPQYHIPVEDVSMFM